MQHYLYLFSLFDAVLFYIRTCSYSCRSRMTTKDRKLVVVGDGACGKTALLIVFSEDRFQVEHVPTVCEKRIVDVECEGKSVGLVIWDTPGVPAGEGNEGNKWTYPDTDVLLICYSIVEPDTLGNVIEKVTSPHILSFYSFLYVLDTYFITSDPRPL